MELNETKLANAVGASGLRPALSEEVRAVGAEPGYGSPLGVEIKARSDSAGYVIPIEEVVAAVNKEISRQEAQIHCGDSVASAPDESLS
jgi:hypothetical protein